MVCNCFNFHRVTGLAAGEGQVTMTISNGTNISSLDPFELVLCLNPNTVVTGAPVPYKITVNGSEADLLNKYSLPIYTDRLRMRKRYYGSYVAPAEGTPYVILWNTPNCPRYAVGGITPVTAVTTEPTESTGATESSTENPVSPSVAPTTRSAKASSSTSA